MHIHEKNPKRTMITLVLFIAVIVVGLITLTGPRLKYQINPQEAINILFETEHGVDASQISNMLSASNSQTILIDIRNNYDYARGHIASADNISAVELLTKDNISWLNELKANSTQVVIYGDTPLQTNGPWMVLQQLGFDNITYLKGGYNYYIKYIASEKNNAPIAAYEAGKPNCNYAEVAAVGSVVDNATKPAKKHTIVKRKKKGKAVAGGC